MTQFSRFKPDDEPGRLAALDRYEIVQDPESEDFGDIMQLVRSVLGVNFAAVTLLSSDTQHVIATAGVDPWSCPREDSFCTYTIQRSVPMMVVDALKDERFVNNPFVVGPAQVRSYLGVPLTTPEGYNVGALCVWGDQPREFSEAEAALLANFGKVVVSQLELRQSARQDALTGVLTRRAFQEKLATALSRAESTPVHLVLIDIDHFKSINDTYGHPAGDQVLRRVADCLVKTVRKGDPVGRLGGEEFAIMLCKTEAEGARALCERLRNTVSQEQLGFVPARKVTISLGLAQVAEHETAEAVMERADQALYEAKRTGRNRVALATPVDPSQIRDSA